MSFEAQLKSRYADAHQRLVNGNGEKQHLVASFPPITIRPAKTPAPEIKKTEEIEVPKDSSPISTATISSKPTMWSLLKWVSATEGVSITELRGARHTKAIYRVRFIFCYLARVYAGASLPAIGRFVGGRDHTTVLNAVNKIRVYRLSNAQLCQDVAYYESILDQSDPHSEMRCPRCGGVIPSYPRNPHNADIP